MDGGTKAAVGTAYHTSCQVWFTLADGIVNEVYYPHVDRPNTRDLQFLITDGETFVHEEKRDLHHVIEYPEQDSLLVRLTNSDPGGRYRIVKEILCDPHHSVLLVQTRVEIFAESLRGKLRLFALLAPHLNRGGRHNTAHVCNTGGRALFQIRRADAASDPNSADLHMAFGAQPDFLRRSCGYVGASDGWQDLRNFEMDWEFPSAEDGNIAVMGECDFTNGEFLLVLGFGRSPQGAATKALQAFATPYAKHRKAFVQDWREVCAGPAYAEFTGDEGALFRLSRLLLHAHEDKVFCGAIVASLSIPWGETKGDNDLGGYHLVWPRDLVQSCTGLLAASHTDAPARALIWLACLQERDGQLPQNAWIDGEAFWSCLQLDEVAAPILLAWRVREAGALAQFDPWVLVSKAAGYLIAHGPVTMQKRWEECSGYSPATLATCIAGLVIVAVLARERGDHTSADFALAYADWLEAHLDEWTSTTRGELVPGKPWHYLRITPADASNPHARAEPDVLHLGQPNVIPPSNPHARAEPDTALLDIVNGRGSHPARNVVSLEFLQLVRLGLRDPHDPLIVESVKVVDKVLRHDLPPGPSWQRYNGDRYGQHDDGAPFDGTGTGGCWPLPTGERGHYELAAGRDPHVFIEAMERFANAGQMLPEQVWCGDDLPGLQRGAPTGSAMPLCWAHAEYLSLVRSAAEGKVFERIAPAYERYVRHRPQARHEMWSCAHRIASMAPGQTLRIITPGPAERILAERRGAAYTSNDLYPSEESTIQDLDLNFFRGSYLPSAIAPDVLAANRRSVEQQLATCRFVVGPTDLRPTMVGCLVLSLEPRRAAPGAYVQFVRFDGTDLASPIIDQAEIGGPLSDLLRVLDEKIRAHIRTRTDISNDQEVRRPDYPTVAIQQLLRNSIMHRSFRGTNAPVRVSWFSDRIEIQNPGGPFGQVTQENFGSAGITDYRNPHLAEAMKVLGYVQRFGVGIATARAEMGTNGNPPIEFSVTQNYVHVTLRCAP